MKNYKIYLIINIYLSSLKLALKYIKRITYAH